MTGSKRKNWLYRLLEPQGFGRVLKRQGHDPRKESRVDGCFVMGGEKAIASDAAHSVPGKDMLLNQNDLNQLGLEKKFVHLSGKQGVCVTGNNI